MIMTILKLRQGRRLVIIIPIFCIKDTEIPMPGGMLGCTNKLLPVGESHLGIDHMALSLSVEKTVGYKVKSVTILLPEISIL